MHAAVVTAFDRPPRYQEMATPEANGPREALVEVLAVGLHPRVRSQANGSHYTSTGALPLVPGIDGVGRAEDGTLRYFLLPDTPMGAMAERTVIDLRRSIELPEESDPVQVAAVMNPVMSSWIALRHRTDFQPGQRVLVLAATGNAGQLAVQVAKLLGASHVTAAGRDSRRLAGLVHLGADATVAIDPGRDGVAMAEGGSDVDVVLDYLWGQPTADALRAIVPARADDEQPLTWVQVGSAAGPESPIPSAVLRACPLQIVGSGQGSVAPRDFLKELPQLMRAIAADAFAIDARPVRLADVEKVWVDEAGSRSRIVVVP